ncbi:MAG: hypothetical protein INF16_00300 [Methylobacterium sp.]|nr:hypothetical protein [Methylobacterium sp.]MCA3637929.1 hypothetical protein [Methylobacterium sp.]
MISVAAMAGLSGLVAGNKEGGDEKRRITLMPVKTKAGTRQSVPGLRLPVGDEGFMQIRIGHERDPMLDLATKHLAMIGTRNVIATDGINSSNRIISQYGLIPPSASSPRRSSPPRSPQGAIGFAP